MNVVVIAPHPDDEAIGCGGTVCLHADRGDRVVTVFLTSGELALPHLPKAEAWAIREGEAAEAARLLGTDAPIFLRLPDWFVGDAVGKAAVGLRPVLDLVQPDIVYLPHRQEWHPDHQASVAVLRAVTGGNHIPTVRAYEIWTPLQEHDWVEDIGSVIERKMCAIAAYRSQLDHFRYDRAIRGLNEYRGILAGRCAFAEVFASVELT